MFIIFVLSIHYRIEYLNFGLTLIPIILFKVYGLWDFPVGPVVQTSPSNAGGVLSIPGQGSKIPHASGLKNENIKQKK